MNEKTVLSVMEYDCIEGEMPSILIIITVFMLKHFSPETVSERTEKSVTNLTVEQEK